MSLFELKHMAENNIQNIKYSLKFCESIYFDESELIREFKSICHPRKLQEEMDQWTTLLKKINQEIYQECHHEFVMDYIDLNLERSQTIHYCKHCLLEEESHS
jgi:predicted translin family RNA/ssDNA-binding protein